jgi:hypothetical protein
MINKYNSLQIYLCDHITSISLVMEEVLYVLIALRSNGCIITKVYFNLKIEAEGTSEISLNI